LGTIIVEKSVVEALDGGLDKGANGARSPPFEVRGPEDVDRVIAAGIEQQVGDAVVVVNPMFLRYREQIADSLMEQRLPGISVWRSFAGRLAHRPWAERVG